MKRKTNKITVILLVVMLITAIGVNAYAATTLNPINQYVAGGSFTVLTSHQRKSGSTPLCITLDENYLVSGYQVRALGCKSDGTDTLNLTYYDGRLVDHVSCAEGVYYGVKSLIKERGYNYATMSLLGNGAGGNATGYWSADSAQDHPIATP